MTLLFELVSARAEKGNVAMAKRAGRVLREVAVPNEAKDDGERKTQRAQRNHRRVNYERERRHTPRGSVTPSAEDHTPFQQRPTTG